MKINKKFGIIAAIVIALFIVVASCASAQASVRNKPCVSRSEWFDFGGNMSPNRVSKLFGTSGKTVRMKVVDLDQNPYGTNAPYEIVYVTVRYNKCGSWGKDRHVVIQYRAEWERPQTVDIMVEAFPWNILKY